MVTPSFARRRAKLMWSASGMSTCQPMCSPSAFRPASTISSVTAMCSAGISARNAAIRSGVCRLSGPKARSILAPSTWSPGLAPNPSPRPIRTTSTPSSLAASRTLLLKTLVTFTRGSSVAQSRSEREQGLAGPHIGIVGRGRAAVAGDRGEHDDGGRVVALGTKGVEIELPEQVTAPDPLTLLGRGGEEPAVQLHGVYPDMDQHL